MVKVWPVHRSCAVRTLKELIIITYYLLIIIYLLLIIFIIIIIQLSDRIFKLYISMF